MPRRRTLATGIHALRSLDGGYALGILPILFGTADAGQADPRLALLGSAHTLSPDARYGHPDLRSLGGVCALALRASLATYAVSRGWAAPR